MRITCFALGVLSIVACAVMVFLGIGADSEASSTVSSLRAAPAYDAAAYDSAAINDSRADSYALAQIFGLVGVAWMVGAAAFGPTRSTAAGAVSSGPAPQPWSAQSQYSPERQPARPYPAENPHYPDTRQNPPFPG
jgi:hypothetical protein